VGSGGEKPPLTRLEKNRHLKQRATAAKELLTTPQQKTKRRARQER